MDKLPFLVAHGALVAKLVVVAFAVLGVWLGLTVRRRRDRGDASGIVSVMTAGVVPLAERPLIVRGTLVGSATTLTENTRGGEAPRSERSDDLAVRVSGEAEPIAIAGDAVVLRGTSVAVAWSGAPAGTPPSLAAGATGLGRRLFRLAPGDAVLAAGVASKRPDGRWELRGEHGASVELVATSPATRPRPPSALWLASVLGLCCGAGYLIGIGVGTAAESHAHVDTDAHADTIDIPFAIQLAAAMPRSREDALRSLDLHLEYNYDRSAQLVSLRRELAGLRGGCDDEVRFLADAGQPEDVIAAGASCPAGRQPEVAALVALGRYPEAAARAGGLNLADVAQARLAAVANVGAGRWAEAAGAYDAIVKTEHAAADADDTNLVRDECLAAWFRLRGGDAASKAKLAELAPRGTLCGALAAIESPGPDLAARLEALGGAEHPHELGQSSFAYAMAWAYGSRHGMSSFDLAVSPLGVGSSSVRETLLWELAAASRANPARDQFDVALAHAAFDIVRGDLADAAAQLKLTTADVDPKTYEDPSAIAAAEAVLELHAGTQPIAVPKDTPGVDRFIAIRNGDSTGDLTLLGGACNLATAFRGAITSGDAGDLVGRLAGCRYLDQFQDPYLLALAPRIKTHRAELVRELDLEPQPYTGSRSAIDLIPHAMVRRTVAKLLGDGASATRWQGIVDRQLAVMSDRGRAIAMIALDTSFF